MSKSVVEAVTVNNSEVILAYLDGAAWAVEDESFLVLCTIPIGVTDGRKTASLVFRCEHYEKSLRDYSGTHDHNSAVLCQFVPVCASYRNLENTVIFIGYRDQRGCSSMVEQKLPKLTTRKVQGMRRGPRSGRTGCPDRQRASTKTPAQAANMVSVAVSERYMPGP